MCSACRTLSLSLPTGLARGSGYRLLGSPARGWVPVGRAALSPARLPACPLALPARPAMVPGYCLHPDKSRSQALPLLEQVWGPGPNVGAGRAEPAEGGAGLGASPPPRTTCSSFPEARSTHLCLPEWWPSTTPSISQSRGHMARPSAAPTSAPNPGLHDQAIHRQKTPVP